MPHQKWQGLYGNHPTTRQILGSPDSTKGLAAARLAGLSRPHPRFTTKTDARSWATVTEAEMERGVYVDRSEAEKNTLGDLLQRYLAEQMVPLRIRLRHHGSLLSTRRGFVSQPSIAVGVQRTLLYRSRPKLMAPGL